MRGQPIYMDWADRETVRARFAAPGDMPRCRLKARWKAASDS
jgi:hypothetical protein